jgi:predicted cupin superfamily sugar epimerase
MKSDPAETRCRELIAALALLPHPEGGFFCEAYRACAQIDPRDGRTLRSALTTIYFLLPRGSHSRWHRVLSDEVWHLYEGGPVQLMIANPDLSAVESKVLAGVGSSGSTMQVVPAGWWQAAASIDNYALCGCTVGPGFDFADFSFAATSTEQNRLRAFGVSYSRFI